MQQSCWVTKCPGGLILQWFVHFKPLQVARLQREERLGALNLELANRKVLRLSELRGFTRAVRHSPNPHRRRTGDGFDCCLLLASQGCLHTLTGRQTVC